MKKILIMSEPQDNGWCWYRLTQFAKKSKELGIADVQFIDYSLQGQQVIDLLKAADVYLTRLGSDLGQFIDYRDKNHPDKLIFADMDDGLDAIDPYSDLYRTLGTKQFKHKDKWLWKDGESGFNLQENRNRVKRSKEALKRVDFAITTTLDLADYVTQYNENVAVIPNAINMDIFPPIKIEKPKDEIRILWSGGSTHFQDLMSIQNVVKKIMYKYENVHFYMLGVPFKAFFRDLPTNRVHTMGWIKPDGHGYRLATVGADIGITPINDTDFNRLKSSVKFYEHSALKVPTISPNIPPYNRDIKDNFSGLLYNDNREFEKHLETLINDSDKRSFIGENAYNYVKEFRNLEKITREWVELLTQSQK